MNKDYGSAYFLAMENASDMMVITDTQGVVMYANRALKESTGYDLEEAIGQKAGKLWGNLMDKEYYSEMWKTIKEEKSTFRGEFKNKRKNGEVYYAAVNISPVVVDDGQIKYFVAVERDITKAREIDRMKTEFVSLTTHQLRTPLSSVRWLLDVVITDDKHKLDAEHLETLKQVNRINEQMIELVNSLLDISRIESGRIVLEKIAVDLPGLAREMADSLKNKFEEKKIALELNFGQGVPQVTADPKYIRQVYMNFLTNAIKYTPDNGMVTVSIYQDGDKLISEVADNGIGILEADKDKIFGKFFRGENVKQITADGTGLGLYLVRDILEASGGKVWFESQEGKGSKFFFSLPGQAGSNT